MALSTVSAVLKRVGLGTLSLLEPPEPPNRYQRSPPRRALHVDIKKLGRIRGAGHHVAAAGPARRRRAATASTSASPAGNSCTCASMTLLVVIEMGGG